MADLAALERAAKDASAKAEAARKLEKQKMAAIDTAKAKEQTSREALAKAINARDALKAKKTATANEKAASERAVDAAGKKRDAEKQAVRKAQEAWSDADNAAKAKEASAKDASAKYEAAKKEAQKKAVSTAVNKTVSTVKKTVNTTVSNAKKDPIGAAAGVAKAAVGGVQGAVQTGISAVANSKLLKGTKTGTTLDLVNNLVSVPGAWQDIGIDAIAALASGIYKGKPVSQLDDIVIAAAKESTKGNVDAVVDKTMACLKAYDVDFSKQDLAKFANDLKKSAKAKLR